jgi:hypothetical protein
MNRAPLDHPTPERPHRVYATLTNHCNRACPWCSTCSSPRGSTWLSLERLRESLPPSGNYELQLEGGEPTIHPEFLGFVDLARADPRCTRLVVSTNGVVIPRQPVRLAQWLARLGAPLTLKLSVNHHLLERDPGLVALAISLRLAMADAGADRLLVLNVRRRRGAPGDDQWVVDEVERAGLIEHANVFFLQRYGFASGEDDWEAPWLVGHDFRIVNPDGRVFGPDLVARAEAMRVLP